MFKYLLAKKIKIAFVVENPVDYYSAMASTRLRCYDIINYLNKHKFKTELFNPENNYDIVIFQKCFNENYIELANELKNKGTIIILDININVIELKGHIEIFDDEKQESLKQQNKDIAKMVSIVDVVLVSSNNLLNVYSKFHDKVFCVEENVSDDFFKYKKEHVDKNDITLLYIGYSIKAIELKLIKDVLIQLNKKYNIGLLCISENNPRLNIISQEFIEYNQKELPKQMLQGDIKISPRDLTNNYNLGHSFTKAAYPLAVGIPVVASPVPSYYNRHVIICETEDEWYSSLENLIKNHHLRTYYGEQGREFVRNFFSISTIGKKYIDIFNMVLK